jgi:putative MATE family efflux protein
MKYERKKYATQFARMTEEPVSRLIPELGLPTTVSMLVTNIYNMADTWFVGQINTSASGATGVVFGLMAIIQAFGFLFGHGSGSNASRHLGAQNVDRARNFSATGFWCAFAAGISISVLGLIYLTPLCRLLGSTHTILPYARTYAFYILLAAPAMATSCVMNNILRYEGHATFAMIGLTAGGLLNIFGDALFMLGFHMGIAGAGLSTMISQYISAGILASMYIRGKAQTSLHPRYITRRYQDLFSILATGAPSLARQGLNSVSTMVLNGLAGVYGDAAVAAMSIVARVSNFLFCVGIGIGQGFQPVSAFNFGARKYSRVRQGIYFTMWFGSLLMAVFSLFGFMFSHQIVTLFRNDPDVILIGTFALRLQCTANLVQAISIAGGMLFQSIGFAGRATLLSALRSGLVFIPVILLFTSIFGLTGIQIAQPVSDLLTTAITIPFVIRFCRHLPPDGTDPKDL